MTEQELVESEVLESQFPPLSGSLRLRWSRRNAWRVEVLRADRVVEFADEFLEALHAQDRMDVSVGDGILTIRGTNRTVSYGLGRRDPLRQTTFGHLSGAERGE